MTELKTKTVVAPCEGGPLDGKLKRMDRSIVKFTIPTVLNGAHVFAGVTYRKVRKRDGSTVWKYDEAKSL